MISNLLRLQYENQYKKIDHANQNKTKLNCFTIILGRGHKDKRARRGFFGRRLALSGLLVVRPHPDDPAEARPQATEEGIRQVSLFQRFLYT
jgi:hypothetical protein